MSSCTSSAVADADMCRATSLVRERAVGWVILRSVVDNIDVGRAQMGSVGDFERVRVAGSPTSRLAS